MTRKSVLLAIEVLAPVAIVVTWYLASANSASFYFPPLAEILKRFQQIWLGEGFVSNALPSLGRMLTGYGLAAVLGIVIGLALGLSKWASKLLSPTVEFLRAVPSVVLIPFGMVVFGVDTTMKV